MTTPEQQARQMLGRMKVEHADYYSAGDLVELANLIAENAALKAELAAINGAGEPVAWANLGDLISAKNGRERYGNQGAPDMHTWSEGGPSNYHDTPLYTRPAVPLTDERIHDLVLATVYQGDATTQHRDAWAQEIGIPFARAIEAAHEIKE